MSAVQRAIDHAGGLTELANLLEVTPQVIVHWRTRGAPAKRCADIERITGGAVTREQLRPDIFGEPPAVSGEQAAAA